MIRVIRGWSIVIGVIVFSFFFHASLPVESWPKEQCTINIIILHTRRKRANEYIGREKKQTFEDLD